MYKSVFDDEINQSYSEYINKHTTFIDDNITMREAFNIILFDDSFTNLDVINMVRLLTKRDPIGQTGGGRIAEAWNEAIGLSYKTRGKNKQV